MFKTILDIRNLQVQFVTEERAKFAVDGISFQLQQGEKLGIVGESGSGKSITSLAIMGLIPPPGKITQGEVWLKTQENKQAVDLLRLSEQQKRVYRGGEIGMIFQEPMTSLNPVYDIGFQITEAILLHQKVREAEAKKKAIALLQEVKLIATDREIEQQFIQESKQRPSQKQIDEYINQQKKAFLARYPHQLSGGQLQRVTIAMAISCNPSILIADEPTTALDVTVQATILELLRDLCRDRQMSLIFITHDLGVIRELVDKVAVMYRGEIVEMGNVSEVFAQPKHPYTKGLLACRPRLDRNWQYLPTVPDFVDIKTNNYGRAIFTEINPDLSKFAELNITPEAKEIRSQQLTSQQPLLEAKNLTVAFPIKGMFGGIKRYFMAVNDVSFVVYPGETLGLVGESGCGKSTLARTLLRLIPLTSGEIIFDKQSISYLQKESSLRALRREMQIVFQNPYSSLNPRLTIGKAIMEPLVIYQWKKSKERLERVKYLLEKVGLDPDWINRYPHQLSGGQRQRVCIARALALQPRFIICDESVSALDVSVQAQVLNLLKQLQQEFELTYIFISHDLSVVKFMSDRIIVMNKGKIEEINKAEEIYLHPQQEYTRKLIAAIPNSF